MRKESGVSPPSPRLRRDGALLYALIAPMVWLAAMVGATAAAQTAGTYTAAQADAGRAIFDRSCATRHMTAA